MLVERFRASPDLASACPALQRYVSDAAVRRWRDGTSMSRKRKEPMRAVIARQLDGASIPADPFSEPKLHEAVSPRRLIPRKLQQIRQGSRARQLHLIEHESHRVVPPRRLVCGCSGLPLCNGIQPLSARSRNLRCSRHGDDQQSRANDPATRQTHPVFASSCHKRSPRAPRHILIRVACARTATRF